MNNCYGNSLKAATSCLVMGMMLRLLSLSFSIRRTRLIAVPASVGLRPAQQSIDLAAVIVIDGGGSVASKSWED